MFHFVYWCCELTCLKGILLKRKESLNESSAVSSCCTYKVQNYIETNFSKLKIICKCCVATPYMLNSKNHKNKNLV